MELSHVLVVFPVRVEEYACARKETMALEKIFPTVVFMAALRVRGKSSCFMVVSIHSEREFILIFDGKQIVTFVWL